MPTWRKLILHVANLCTKFEVSCLNPSRDIFGKLKIYNGSCDVITPISWMACRLGLAMVTLPTKCEVSMFTHYEDTKGNTNVRIWEVWEVKGHSGSPTMSPFDKAHTTSYSTLTETMHLSCTVFELQQVICQKLPILTYSTFTGHHHRGDPVWHIKERGNLHLQYLQQLIR